MMTLPPIDQRSTTNLEEERKRLEDTRGKVDSIARDLKMEPYFAAPIRRIDEAIESIEGELTRRLST